MGGSEKSQEEKIIFLFFLRLYHEFGIILEFFDNSDKNCPGADKNFLRRAFSFSYNPTIVPHFFYNLVIIKGADKTNPRKVCG